MYYLEMALMTALNLTSTTKFVFAIIHCLPRQYKYAVFTYHLDDLSTETDSQKTLKNSRLNSYAQMHKK